MMGAFRLLGINIDVNEASAAINIFLRRHIFDFIVQKDVLE